MSKDIIYRGEAQIEGDLTVQDFVCDTFTVQDSGTYADGLSTTTLEATGLATLAAVSSAGSAAFTGAGTFGGLKTSTFTTTGLSTLAAVSSAGSAEFTGAGTFGGVKTSTITTTGAATLTSASISAGTLTNGAAGTLGSNGVPCLYLFTKRLRYQDTIGAAQTGTYALFTVPEGASIRSIYYKVATTFDGNSWSSPTLSIGAATGFTSLINAQAMSAGWVGDAVSEVGWMNGTSGTAQPQNEVFYATSTPISARIDAGGGTMGGGTAGDLTIYVTYVLR